jgi:uncharacterized protein YydD (DUF2326 family)
MRAQRVWKVIQPESQQDRVEINKLHAELAVLKKRIADLEQVHPKKHEVEALKAGAIVLAQRIDEVRCFGATRELASLLSR